MKTLALYLNQTGSMLLYHICAFSFIYMIPTWSHVLSYPLYYIEPMRIVVLLSLWGLSKDRKYQYAYVLCFTLPLFSFFISGHPVFIKSLLISVELFINVFLYRVFVKTLKNRSKSVLLSVLSSKIIYYQLKWILLSVGLLGGGLIATPIIIQIITTIAFGILFNIKIKSPSGV